MSEPWLFIDGHRIYGDDITEYHRKYMTGGCAHCAKCGAPFNNYHEPDIKCWHCGKCPFIELTLDKKICDKIEKDNQIIEEYKEKTKDANFGQY